MLTALLAVLWSLPVLAGREIELTQLGQLALDYRPAVRAEGYAGPSLAAEVTFRPGEAFVIVTPYRVQRLEYLLEPGADAVAGQPIARLHGAEVHHFRTEFEIRRQMLAEAEQRFDRNRSLYQDRAIEAGQWREVSEAYYAAKLEFEHLRHFNDLLVAGDPQEDSVTLTTPVSGIIDFRQNAPGVAAGEAVAIAIPRSALRLKAWFPVRQRGQLAGFRTAGCELEVALVGQVVRDFFVEVWSEPVDPDCGLLPGQRLMVTPSLKLPAYRVDGRSIFQLGGEPHLFLRREDRLVAIPVTIAGNSGPDYVVTAEQTLEGRDVLVTSVSAVQGILLGLGGE